MIHAHTLLTALGRRQEGGKSDEWYGEMSENVTVGNKKSVKEERIEEASFLF